MNASENALVIVNRNINEMVVIKKEISFVSKAKEISFFQPECFLMHFLVLRLIVGIAVVIGVFTAES